MKKNIFLLATLFAVIFIAGCSSGSDESVAEERDFEVQLENLDASSLLSHGVYVVYTGDSPFDFEGENIPEALELLAEIGSAADFEAYAKTLPNVVGVFVVDPIAPGESATLALENIGSSPAYYLAGIQMIVDSNDAYTLVDGIPLNGNAVPVIARNFDAGTEVNAATLGCGFDCGQPDPTRGEENVDNGETESIAVAVHSQATTDYLRVSVTTVVPSVEATGDVATGDVAQQ